MVIFRENCFGQFGHFGQFGQFRVGASPGFSKLSKLSKLNCSRPRVLGSVRNGLVELKITDATDEHHLRACPQGPPPARGQSAWELALVSLDSLDSLVRLLGEAPIRNCLK